MADFNLELVLVVNALLIFFIAVTIAYSRRRRRQRAEQLQGVVVIQEGRFPGESDNNKTCPSCMRKFKVTAIFEGELLKCPYCGKVID